MIRNSFIFLDKISHSTEKRIWNSGITSWNEFLDAKTVPGISQKRKGYYDRCIFEAKQHLAAYDAEYFSTRFPKSEMWRLYDYFKDDCVFVDIETTGKYADISVLGLYDGKNVMSLVKYKGLTKENVNEILSNYKLIISFNGLSFDVPMINRYFNCIVPDVPHIDLRFPLAKLGYSGGLKNIESILGIKRSEATSGMSGGDAILLWQDYATTGNEESLNLLVEYNTEDIINLKPLAEFIFKELSSIAIKEFSKNSK